MPLAAKEISKAMGLYRISTNNTETIAVGELFCIYFDAIMKVRFGDALRLGYEILDHRVFNVPVEKLGGQKTCI